MGGCTYFGFQQIKTDEAEQKSPTSPLQQDSCSAFNSAAVYGRPALIQAPLCYCSLASPQLNLQQMKA